MHLKSLSPKRLALLLFVVAPLSAWFFVKPVRVLAPTFEGVTCLTPSVCVEDPSKYQSAQQLYSDGLSFVTETISPIQGAPKVIFCSTEICADSFGLGKRSAVTVGTIGTVIGPRAWKPYYVRHELIHYLQAQQLGTMALLFKPSWFKEGMAYSLSQDPRPKLAEPWQSYRKQFSSWYVSVGKGALWQEARKL